jgi:predicted signal transduction protein with EAL and GGDEF domain
MGASGYRALRWATVAEGDRAPADALALEIADGAVPDEGRARATVARLHEMGVCVALDDYGTGRSSVVLLHQLPVDQLTRRRCTAEPGRAGGSRVAHSGPGKLGP